MSLHSLNLDKMDSERAARFRFFQSLLADLPAAPSADQVAAKLEGISLDKIRAMVTFLRKDCDLFSGYGSLTELIPVLKGAQQLLKAGEVARHQAELEKRIAEHGPLCERCGGAGRMSAYSHVSGGVCFDCNGTGHKDQE